MGNKGQKNSLSGLINFVFFCIIVGFSLHLLRIYMVSDHKIRYFGHIKGNYDIIQTQYQWGAAAWEAKQVIPENAKITITPTEWNLERILTRYTLYPRQLSEDWSYAVDLDKTIQAQPGWQAIRLRNGSMLYAKPDHAFEQMPIHQYSFKKVIAVVALSSLWYIVVGFLATARINIPIYRGGMFWFIGLNYLMGFLLLNLGSWLAVIFKIQLNRFSILGIWGVILLGLLLVSGSHIKQKFKEIQKCFSRPSAGAIIQNIAFTGVMLYLFISILVTPVNDWDSMFHWILQAKMMFHEGQFAIQYPNLSYYPLLWPLSITSNFILFGADYDGLASVSAAVVFLVFVSQFLGCCRIINIRKDLLWMPLMFYLTFFYHQTFFYYKIAEPIFLCFVLSAVSAMLLWLKNPEDKRPLYLATLLTLGLSLIKLEGIVATIIIYGTVFLTRPLHLDKKETGLFALLFLMPIVFMMGWRWWVNAHGFYIPISHFEHGLNFEKFALFFKLLKQQLSLIRPGQQYLLVLLLASWFFGKRDLRQTSMYLGILFLVYAVFSCVSILGVYDDRLEGQMIWATPRIFFQISPVLMLWWASVCLEKNPVKVEEDYE